MNFKKIFNQNLEYNQNEFIADIINMCDSHAFDYCVKPNAAAKTIEFSLTRGHFDMSVSYSVQNNAYNLQISNNHRGLFGRVIRGIPRDYVTGGDIARTAFNQMMRMDSGLYAVSELAQNYLIATLLQRNPPVTRPYASGYSIDTDFFVRTGKIANGQFSAKMWSVPAGAPVPSHFKTENTEFARRVFETLQEMYQNQQNAR